MINLGIRTEQHSRKDDDVKMEKNVANQIVESVCGTKSHAEGDIRMS